MSKYIGICNSVFLGIAFVAVIFVQQAKGAPNDVARPNVLLIVVDDMRPALGCYGDPVARTPHMDRLAKRGVRFDRAYCQYPICGPSRASFLSGLRPETSGYYGWAAPAKFTYLPAWLKRHGYYTAEFGKIFHHGRLSFDNERDAYEKRTGKPYRNPVFRTLNPPGCWDVSDICTTPDDPCGYGYSYGIKLISNNVGPPENVAARGSLCPPKLKGGWYWEEWAELNLPDKLTSDGIVVRRAADAMEHATREGKSFLVAAGIRRPHQVLAAPKPYFDLFPLDGIAIPEPEPREHLDRIPALALTYPKKFSNNIYSDDDRRQLWRAYHANISFVDAQVGVLLATVDRLKLWENTIVVLFSDHGLHLGEHGGLSNKDTLFEESARVPLLVAAPGFTSAGRGSSRPVELVDVFPTLTDLCGLPQPSGLDGTSLRSLLADPQAKAIKGGAFSVVRRRVAGRQGKGFSGRALELPVDAGPEHYVLGRSIRTERWRYTEWDDGNLGAELYDEENDPRELSNLVGKAKFASTQAELKRLLHGHDNSEK